MWSYTNDFGIDKGRWLSSIKKLSLDEFMKHKSVTFRATVEILAQYDANGQEISMLKHKQSIDESMKETKEQITILTSNVNKLSNKMDQMMNNINKLTLSMQNMQQWIIKNGQNTNMRVNNHKETLRSWFENRVKLVEYYELFIENGFEDLDLLTAITMKDLISMGIEKLAHRIKIMQCIEYLKN